MHENYFLALPLKNISISTSIKNPQLSRLIGYTEAARLTVSFTATLGTPWYHPDTGVLLSIDPEKYIKDWPHELAHYLLSGARKKVENYHLGPGTSIVRKLRGASPRIESKFLDTEEVLASELGILLLHPHYSWMETNPWIDLLLELKYIHKAPSRYDSNFSLEPTFQDQDVLELLDAKSKANA